MRPGASRFVAILLGAALSLPGLRREAYAASAGAGSVIPAPAMVEPAAGHFTLSERTRIVVPNDPEVQRIAQYFADLLWRTRQIKLRVITSRSSQPQRDAITLSAASAAGASTSGSESYVLDVVRHGIAVKASDVHGLFYGIVTLWQLLTSTPANGVPIQLPLVHIEDHPQLSWRGFMLDSSRHFMPPEFIKQMLDWMALHKLNTFHWHLTDDQGWRLQILKYPRLTEVGSLGVRPGYYTQDQVREIVRYAADRFITIVPEIDMPGHAQAAINAYPQLGTEGPVPPVSRDWGVHDYLFNADESTLGFLEDVLAEVIGLFPGQYVHVGGDEAVKNRWKASPRVQQRMHELGIANETGLQSYFTHRMEQYLTTHGRKLVGWDEILEGGLPPEALVMSWRGLEGAREAAKQGHDAVLAPAPTLYLDHLQSDLPDEPPGRLKVIALSDLYAFKAEGPHVIGAQINAWTEHMRTPERVVHAAFPKLAAFSEVAWSAPARRNWYEFLQRLPAQLGRYRALGIGFADSVFAVKATTTPADQPASVHVELANQVNRGEIRYTTDGRAPQKNSPRYSDAMTLKMPVTLTAATFVSGERLSEQRSWTLTPQSLQRRTGGELKSCSNKLPLRLEGPAPAQGEAAIFDVDILDPCWVFPQADLSKVRAISAAVGQLPFNFQVGEDAKKIPLHPPQTADGELEVRIDGCKGEPIAVLPLAAAKDRVGVTELPQAAVTARTGMHDLCLYFTRRTIDPIWAIEWVQLVEP